MSIHPGPLYSFDPDTSGPSGGPGSMVMSIACAEGRCGGCDAWFRCDHEHHRRQGGHVSPTLEALRTAAEHQFGDLAALPPDVPPDLAAEIAAT